MAIQESAILNIAAQGNVPMNVVSISNTQMNKDLDRLGDAIYKVNKDNWDKFEWFNKQQTELLKNTNLDLSQVNPIHRKELEQKRLDVLKMFKDKGVKETTRSLEFNQLSQEFAQKVSLSKQAYEYANLQEKQMLKEKDFNTDANRKNIADYRSKSLEELYDADAPIIAPVEAIDWGARNKAIHTQITDKVKGLDMQGGFYGNKEIQTVHTEIAKELYEQDILKNVDTYGNPLINAVFESYKLAHPEDKEPTKEKALEEKVNERMLSNPRSGENFEVKGQYDFRKSEAGQNAQLASKEEIARINAAAKGSSETAASIKSREATQRATEMVDRLPSKTTPISQETFTSLKAGIEGAIEGDSKVVEVKAMLSLNTDEMKAIGAKEGDSVYQVKLEDGTLGYISYSTTGKGLKQQSSFSSFKTRNAIIESFDGVKMVLGGGSPSGSSAYVMQYSDLDASGFNPTKKNGGGTKVDKLNPELKKAYIGLSNDFGALVITSGNDSAHSKSSKHYSNDAIDIRVKDESGKKLKADVISNGTLISNSKHGKIYDYKGYRVLDEGDHLHVTLHPSSQKKSYSTNWIKSGDHQYFGDIQNGKGGYKDKDGQSHIGIFKNGVLVQGKMTLKDGQVQNGLFYDSGELKQGLVTFADGTTEKYVDGKSKSAKGNGADKKAEAKPSYFN